MAAPKDPEGRCPVYRAPVRLRRVSLLRENRHVRRACQRDLRHLEPELRGCHPAGAGARHQDLARGVTSAWIKEQRVKLQDGKIAEYQVNMQVTFVLDA